MLWCAPVHRVPAGSLATCSDLTEDIALSARHALQSMHNLGIAHGDISLMNFVPITSSPAKVIIVNFGCSHFAEVEACLVEESVLDSLFARKVRHPLNLVIRL